MADRDIEQVADSCARQVRILVTGSRSWTDRYAVRRALLRATAGVESGQVTVVHGGATGADALADQVAGGYGWTVERHPAEDFAAHGSERFRVRNQHMVSLGADICLAFADRWASGSGMCARMARDAGIPTEDWGADTRRKAVRPALTCPNEAAS